MLPASNLDGLLCAFDPSNTYFALGTPDGRVRTFDTVTGRLRSALQTSVGPLSGKNLSGVSNGHLAEGHSCLTWLSSQVASAKVPAGPSRSWVAVGTGSGAVKCFDSATGEVQWQSIGCNEGGVEGLAYSSSKSSVLLSSGKDGQVSILDVASGSKQSQFKGSKHGVTAAALSADGQKLILGGSTLSLWDMSSQQRTAKFTGHPLAVRVLAFAPSSGFALSAAEGERLVAVWPTPDRAVSSKTKNKGLAAASLAVEQPVVGLATAAAESEGPGCFYAAATTSTGEAYCWLIRPLGHSAVSSTQLARVAVGDPASSGSSGGGDAGGGECILATALEPSEQGVTLLLVVGSASKPRFERLPVSSAASSSKVTYLQPAAADGLIKATAEVTGMGSTEAMQRMDVDVLGPDNAGEAVQQRAAAISQSRKRQEPEPDVLTATAPPSDEAAEDEEEELLDSGEPTLGQRVAQLQEQQYAATGALGDQPGGAAGTSKAGLPPGPIKADSLGVLLTQALRSSDRTLLEQCLSVSDGRVVANTVKRLVPLDAALLLRAAVERLQSRPARGQQLAAWIQAVLLHHTAYLMAAPGAAPVMSSLYQIIEARLAMHRQLLSLTGRLELLLAQSGAQQGTVAAAAGADVGMQVVYQESDSEAEVELVDAAGGDDTDDNKSEEEEYYTEDDEGSEEGEQESDDL